jgi:alkanesulfonate monooxygenase SsuD/methylene tetrahydromethanopterin reductase-like flavin-dependent oxidoreductase (luciferase family)
MASLGICLPTRSGLAPGRLAALAGDAEQAGFGSCFVAERWGDGVAVLAAMAATTSTVEIGSAISNIYTRHPAVMAMGCAVVDDVSGGRLRLGLGTGNPEASRRLLGMHAEQPMQRMREYVEVLRRMSGEMPASFAGEIFGVDGFMSDFVAASSFPIDIAALQPGMITLATQIADGVILNLVPRSRVSLIVESVRQKVTHADRTDAFRVACVVPVCVTDDRRFGLDRGRNVIADYALHPSVSRLFAQYGHGDTLEKVQLRLRQGDRPGALAQVPDSMVEDFVVIGTTAQCRVALATYLSAGVDLAIAFPVIHPQGWELAIAELMTLPGVATTAGLQVDLVKTRLDQQMSQPMHEGVRRD